MFGDKAFALALLRRGCFDFSDLRRCAQALRQEATLDGGVGQLATHSRNPKLRQTALSARRQEKDAKKWAIWESQGWNCDRWQKQIVVLETGELAAKSERDQSSIWFRKRRRGTTFSRTRYGVRSVDKRNSGRIQE